MTATVPLPYPFPPSSLHEPAPTFARLRDECPVARVVTPDGNVSWMVSTYDGVRDVLTDPVFSRAAAAGPHIPVTGLGRLAAGSMLGMDAPDHTRYRRLVARAFTPRRVEELRPRVRALVGQLLDAVVAAGRPVDLVGHLTLPLPTLVICELLGVPAADRDVLHAWSDTVMTDWKGDPTDLDRTVDSLVEYFTALAAEKRVRPGEDMMTALVTVEEGRDRLTETEIVHLCLGLLIAGHETTVSHLNMAILALMHYRDQWDLLAKSPGLIAHAVDELLRFDQISPGGGTLPRVTTSEVELAGVTLAAGAVVLTATNAANRDACRYADADRLDITRSDNPHLTFGAGIHFCLGAPLARMQLQEAIGGLARRLPDAQLAVPETDLTFKRGMTIRSLEALPITW